MNQNLTTEKYNVEFKESWRDEYPVAYTALREVILNAVIHKDYPVPYPTQISVYNDKLMIWNAGVLPEDWTTETLLGKHTSEPYNPLVAKVFYRAGDIETWGRGMEKVIDACKENDFPSPTAYTQGSGLWVVFNYSDDYVNKLSAIDRGEKIWFDPENGMGSGRLNDSLNGTVKAVVSQNVSQNEDVDSQNGRLNGIRETINGNSETVNETVNGTNETANGNSETINETVNGTNETVNGINETINSTCLNILSFVGENENVNSKMLLQHINVSRATLFRAISFLSSDNVRLLSRKGSDKTGCYILTGEGYRFYESRIKSQQN